MRKKYKKERKRPKLLLALLTYSDADVNLKTESSSTALHTAIKVSTYSDNLFGVYIRLICCEI